MRVYPLNIVKQLPPFLAKLTNFVKFCYNKKMMNIVGLGNPGKKYINTRHNIGFMVVNEFAKENNFPKFRMLKKYNALISKKNNVLLVKPQTFMNNSGVAVKKTIQNQNLIVIHDDIDLLFGKIRISKNRGSAGHKGVESIIKELGSKNFTRLRIGIQPKQGKPKDVEKFVLQNFTRKEKKVIKEIIKKSLAELAKLVANFQQ